jgi:hypothetical protein
MDFRFSAPLPTDPSVEVLPDGHGFSMAEYAAMHAPTGLQGVRIRDRILTGHGEPLPGSAVYEVPTSAERETENNGLF